MDVILRWFCLVGRRSHNEALLQDIQLRIGDFGLATALDSDHDRRRTLCGTPNYIAPEILEKSGHSYEVSSRHLPQTHASISIRCESQAN